jgi:hypothetical protein
LIGIFGAKLLDFSFKVELSTILVNLFVFEFFLLVGGIYPETNLILNELNYI